MALSICSHLTLDVCCYSCTKVCTHLSLGVCSCCTTTTKETQIINIRAPLEKASDQGARRSWGYSTDLTLFDDPWKIKKELKESDLGHLSRLLLATELAQDLVLPVLGDFDNERGVQLRVLDVDTNSTHYLIFKRWVSSRSYVFKGKWVKDFVARRGLKKGDVIGLQWDSYNKQFNFSVLQRS